MGALMVETSRPGEMLTLPLDQFILSLPQVDCGICDRLATTQALDRSETVTVALLQALANKDAMQQLLMFTEATSAAIAASHIACADHILASMPGVRNPVFPWERLGHIHDEDEDDDDDD